MRQQSVAFKLKVQGWSDSGKLSSFTAQFDRNGVLLNPQTVANSRQFGWGKWQTSIKVPCSYGDCWWVSTPGHGGFILVTQHKDLPKFKEPARNVNCSYGGKVYYFAVYEFEEDCDWAILEYSDPKVQEFMRNRHNAWEHVSPKSQEEWMEMILQTLRSWNPSFIQEVAS
jgi:hypothetical protein